MNVACSEMNNVAQKWNWRWQAGRMGVLIRCRMGQEEEGAAGQGSFRENGLNGHWLSRFLKKRSPPPTMRREAIPKTAL